MQIFLVVFSLLFFLFEPHAVYANNCNVMAKKVEKKFAGSVVTCVPGNTGFQSLKHQMSQVRNIKEINPKLFYLEIRNQGTSVRSYFLDRKSLLQITFVGKQNFKALEKRMKSLVK